MLKYIIKDAEDRSVCFTSPLKVSIVSSLDAPADRLSAVFAVKGDVPALYSAEVLKDGERVFYGLIDEQSVELNRNGSFLSVSARSLAALLLDNEAHPQIYCSPSMPLLMKRHFEPLGFKSYRGTEKAFNGQLVVSKGMSEWSLLKSFCRYFAQTEPRITKNGVIDISGEQKDEVLCLAPDRAYSIRHELRNKALISEIRARTYASGDYIMPIKSDLAEELRIQRKRYVNAVGSRSGTVISSRRIIKQSEREYESLVVGCAGCMLCDTGITLRIAGDKKQYRIREVVYTLDTSGEKTSIYAEVKRE